MMFPFRSSAIFRNRWIALLWAFGICLMASEIVDSLSGITKAGHGSDVTRDAPADPAAPPTPALSVPPPGGPPVPAEGPVR